MKFYNCALQYCTKHTSCYSLRPCSVTAAVTSLELCCNDNNYNVANNPHFIVHAEISCEFFSVSYQYIASVKLLLYKSWNLQCSLRAIKTQCQIVFRVHWSLPIYMQNIVMPQVQSNIEAALSVIPATSPILLDRCAACYYWHALLRCHAYTYLKP